MDHIAAAEQVAATTHAGQTDKAGHPYLDHPRRVATRVATITNDPDAVAVAWLHDVVEDTPRQPQPAPGVGLQRHRRPGRGRHHPPPR